MSTIALVMFLVSLGMGACLLHDHAWVIPIILAIEAGAVHIGDTIRGPRNDR